MGTQDMSAATHSVARLEAAIGAHLALARIQGGGAPARIQDRFEVRAVLGSGAFGTVVRAWDPQVGREVAIKCIPVEDPWRSFEQLRPEAHALGKICAAEVVDVYDCAPAAVTANGEWLPCLMIVMQYVRGSNLRGWGLTHHDLPRTLAVMTSAAKGLEAAHAVGVIHRDFKPENVMVTSDGQARVVDFGLAYLASRTAAVGAQLVQRGSFGLGTLEYMAPEMIEGEVSTRSDQFAFAVTAWEMLTGRRPFERAGARAGMKPNDLKGASKLPRELVSILGRALRYDVRDRFESIAELRTELERDRGRLGRFVAVAAGAAAALGAVATTAYLAGKHDDDGSKKH